MVTGGGSAATKAGGARRAAKKTKAKKVGSSQWAVRRLKTDGVCADAGKRQDRVPARASWQGSLVLQMRNPPRFRNQEMKEYDSDVHLLLSE